MAENSPLKRTCVGSTPIGTTNLFPFRIKAVQGSLKPLAVGQYHLREPFYFSWCRRVTWKPSRPGTERHYDLADSNSAIPTNLR